jgi:hypothetical protein
MIFRPFATTAHASVAPASQLIAANDTATDVAAGSAAGRPVAQDDKTASVAMHAIGKSRAGLLLQLLRGKE